MGTRYTGGIRNWRYWLLRELGIPVRRGRPRKVRPNAVAPVK